MRELTTSDIREIQRRLGGATDLPSIDPGGETAIEKAAALGYSLIRGGHKSLGHAALEVTLVLNGFELQAEVDEQEQMILGVADGSVAAVEFAEWVSEAAMPAAPVAIPITDTLDLHPFRPREIRDVAREYLIEARAKGYTQVRLIHGRGIGVQRENIRALLASLDFVIEFHDADPSGGGWGSTVVLMAPISLNEE